MSESYLFSEVYIKDPTARQNFIGLIPKEFEILLVCDEEVSVQGIYIDDVISLNIMGNGYSSLDKSYRNWLKKQQVDLAIVSFSSDQTGTTYGFKEGKKVSFKKALKLMSNISRRVETGLTLEMSEDKVMNYLKVNDVDPLEVFQGKRHIDHLVCNSYLEAVEFFIDKGLEENYIVTDVSYSPPREDYLIHKIMYEEGYPLIKKIIEKGTNPNLLDEYGENLCFGAHTIEFFKFLIEVGVNVDQLNQSNQTPMLHYADYFGKYCSIEDVSNFLNIMSLFINAKASPEVFDNDGAGVLLHCRNFPSIQQWFLERFPNLEEYNLSKDREGIVIKLIPSRPEKIDFWEQCLDEKIYSPLSNGILKAMLTDTVYEKTKSNINSHALLRATMLIELACKRDNLNMIHALEKYGFPLLMPAGYSINSYELAIKYQSINILNYMNSKGVNESLISKLKLSISKWLDQVSEALNNENDIDLSQFCSRHWLISHEVEWNRRKPEDRASTLEDHFSDEIKRDLHTTPLRAKNSCFNQIQNVWGTQLFITKSENGVVYSDDSYKFISKVELYESLNLTFEIDTITI